MEGAESWTLDLYSEERFLDKSAFDKEGHTGGGTRLGQHLLNNWMRSPV